MSDDIRSRHWLSTLFRSAGHVVRSASSARAGLDVVDLDDVDILVTEINMTETYGGRLICEARTRRPELPIVLISEDYHGGRAVADIARAWGADGCMIKPFDQEQLRLTIEAALSAHGRGGA